MEEIFTQIVGLSAGLIIFYTIITILLHWLFLRSAIKSGVEAAMLDVFTAIEKDYADIIENIRNDYRNIE